MGRRWFTGRMRSLYAYGDTTPATVASILSSFLWALCLSFPGTLIGPPGIGRPTYRHMAEVADEPIWIAIFVSIFVLQVWRLFCQQAVSHRTFVYFLEVAIKALAAIVWTYIAFACMIAQYPPAAAMSDAIVISGLCWWDFLRCEARPRQCELCLQGDSRCTDFCPYVLGTEGHGDG